MALSADLRSHLDGGSISVISVQTSWWSSPAWLRYERAYGDEPGTRARLLASASWQTRVIDLAQDEAALWRGIRKSYRSLIHATERQVSAVVGGPGVGWLMRTCQQVHRVASGRVTRSEATWDVMEDWVAEDRASVAMLFDYRGPRLPSMRGWPPCIDFAYFVRHDDWAYYFSAASLEKNVHHATIWQGMLALKRLGVRWLEMGWQGAATDERGRHIEFFKTGFGGADVSVQETLALSTLRG